MDKHIPNLNENVEFIDLDKHENLIEQDVKAKNHDKNKIDNNKENQKVNDSKNIIDRKDNSSEKSKSKRKYITKDAKNGVIIAGIMIGVILLLYLAVNYTDNKINPVQINNTPEIKLMKYNNHTFFYEDGLWNVFLYPDSKTKYKIPLHYNPSELVDIKVINKGNNLFANSSKMYLAINPDQKFNNSQNFVLASSELSRNIIGTFDKKVQGVCYGKSGPNCLNREVVDCKTNSTIPIILINNSMNKNINFITPNCVVISGNSKNIVKVTERLIYRWLAIMP